MKKIFLLFVICLFAQLAYGASVPKNGYWNQRLQIGSFRLPPPPSDFQPEYLDLNGDGHPDAISSITIDSIPVLWLDDDGDMRQGDLEGDMDNDCLLLDRDKDGVYDLVVKYADLNGDGEAELQLIADYPKEEKRGWPNGHYMILLDTDHDDVFNYIDWNTMQLKCWEKYGISDFYTDYSGNTAFLKIHTSTDQMVDLRLNWENPFLFYDPDRDGLSEMAIRVLDDPVAAPDAAAQGFEDRQVKGVANWISIAVDLDNDNAQGNDFDFDCTLGFMGGGFDYTDQVHPLRNMRGLPEADKFFIDPRIRQLTELIYPDHRSVWPLIFERGEWKQVYFVFDEDDDCARWERVEFYYPMDPFKMGSSRGGVDNHPQADWAGDRGEWDLDNSGNGRLYVSRFDGRIHLYGAEWGCWRIDQTAQYYQGYDRSWQKRAPKSFATVRYGDTDDNGFFDCIEYDLDGDHVFETRIMLSELGVDDRCELIDVSQYKYANFARLFRKVAAGMWKNAEAACRVADYYGLNTLWYAKWKTPETDREKYNDGYWLQFYIYKDLEDLFVRRHDAEHLRALQRAYFTGTWSELMR